MRKPSGASKRKVPVTSVKDNVKSSIKSNRDAKAAKASGLSITKFGHSHKDTQEIISTFHTLLKKQAQLKSRLSEPTSSGQASALAEELKAVEHEIEERGGLEAYQIASTLGQAGDRGGDSSKVLVNWLTELGEKPETKGEQLRMLEIGALSARNHAARQPWIDNHPIDLNSRHPEILSQDFLQRPLPKTDADRFDLISCSLVLNFVPDPVDRGRMLRLAHDFLLPKPSSYLFIVLPLSCVQNSRYLTREMFYEIMGSVGFVQVKERFRQGGKVIYSLWRRTEVADQAQSARKAGKFSKKMIVNEGKKRNNFCILLA